MGINPMVNLRKVMGSPLLLGRIYRLNLADIRSLMVVLTITIIREAGAVGNMASEIATTLLQLVYQNHLQVFLLDLLRLRELR